MDIKPLTPILATVGLLSIVFGYVKAYTGPFFLISLHKAGYTPEAIYAIYSILTVSLAVSSLAVLLVISGVSYHYGAMYKLTLVSGFVLVVLVYLTEVLGSLVGAVIYQIQAPEYAVLSSLKFQILTSYSSVYLCLIGVLAANYVRETRQHQA